MIQVNMCKVQSMGIFMCLTVITLGSVVIAQETLPYYYGTPHQNTFHDGRRYDTRNSGFNAASLQSNNDDLIRFPDDRLSPATQIHRSNDQYNFNGRHKKDMSRRGAEHEVSRLM